MAKQFYQSQYILNKVFNNTNNILNTSLNTSQDYLNAVYDVSKDSLRVNLAGGMLPAVYSVEDLPPYAEDGQICPVINRASNTITFYRWDGLQGQWVSSGSSTQGLTPPQRQALDWLVQNLDKVKEVTNFNYIVKEDDITLVKDSTVLFIQGDLQNIDDDLDSDNDEKTPYRIDFRGYVMSLSTYADNEAIVPDRYYTRITYDAAGGGLGMSHIYMQQEEYQFFSSLQEGKNILRVNYITNATASPIRKVRYTLNNDKTVTDEYGDVYPVQDILDLDGDEGTTCVIPCFGYVLGVQTYANANSTILDKYYTKITYESDGVHAGHSKVFLSEQEYIYFSNLPNGKNVMDLYYVGTVFPASVTISKTDYKLPEQNYTFSYVVIDADGNPHKVDDEFDKDNDPTSHIKMSINGYVLDMDGYYGTDQPIKKRLIVKMSYNPDFDTTDIYLQDEYYQYVSSLGNGRNVVSIYTLGAGIGIDASRIQGTDDVLDEYSQKPIQNRTVTASFDAVNEKIHELQEEIQELKKK